MIVSSVCFGRWSFLQELIANCISSLDLKPATYWTCSLSTSPSFGIKLLWEWSARSQRWGTKELSRCICINSSHCYCHFSLGLSQHVCHLLLNFGHAELYFYVKGLHFITISLSWLLLWLWGLLLLNISLFHLKEKWMPHMDNNKNIKQSTCIKDCIKVCIL